MIKIGQYIPFHLSIFLSLGILLGFYFEIPIIWSLAILSLLLLVTLVFFKAKTHLKKLIFQISGYLMMLVFGVLIISLENPKNQQNHFTHFYKSDSFIAFQIVESLKPTAYQDKYVAKAISIDSHKVSGQILLNITKDSVSNPIEIGCVYLAKLDLSKIPKPQNPHTFDYADYMRKQSIFHQASLTHPELKKLEIANRSLAVWALKIREKIQGKLQKYPFGKDELGIINALLLGDKQFISKDLQGNYAAAGAVHILAVSGLHVGVLFLILGFIFKPLEKLKHGKIITGISILLFLWIFALIAGMSGSVVRAVTMFSFITVGMLFFKRKSSILYALFTSYFILLVLNPLFIFDVGFQLSYLAVLGIVLFQPKIDSLIPDIQWVFLKKAWQLVSVSVAATLSTLPLSLYYFHQFPGLFVLSNLVIVPALGVILGLGLLIIGLAVCNILPNFLVIMYDTLLRWMNLFIEWIAHQESFLFREIPYSFAMMLLSYFLIAMGYRSVIDKKLPKFQTFLVAILLLQALFIFEKWQIKNSGEMVIFHKSRETIVGIKEATSMQILHSKDSVNPDSYGFLKNYKTYHKIDSIQFNKLKYNLLPSHKTPILIIDSLGIYQNISIKPQFILLTQSTKINLERLIKMHQPQKIIADGSSYPYMVERWKTTCEKAHIPFHYTGSDGAFIIR